MDGVTKCNEAIEMMVLKEKVKPLEWSPILATLAEKMAAQVDFNTIDKRYLRKSKFEIRLI